MNNPKIREQEQAYLILAEDTAEAMKLLVEAEGVAGFDLGEPQVHKIEDTYFDTPDNDLRQSKVTLRKRILDGTTLITVKGIEKQGKTTTQDHSEWEFEWPFGSVEFAGATPETLFTVAGLQPVQKRETTRVSRFMTKSITDPENDEVTLIPIATLSIDSSLYTLSTGQAKMYEVEIERDIDSPLKMNQILKPVEKELPFLARWDHGKFITGKAVEFAFGVKTDENGVLELNSFGFINEMFEQLKVTDTYKKLKIVK